MKERCVLFLFVLLLIVSCRERPIVITVVEIGDNRVEIGKQIAIINKFAPKVVALDFFLVPDSLDKDTILVSELAKLPNTVQAVKLNGYAEPLDVWDSLEISHAKFPISSQGYANILTLDNNTLFVDKLPMQQQLDDSLVFSFSYVVADQSFGVNEKYRNSGRKPINLDLDNFRSGIKIITKETLASGNFNKDDLDGKIVLMGYLGPDEDFFFVDDDKEEKISGVLIQAAIINKIMDF